LISEHDCQLPAGVAHQELARRRPCGRALPSAFISAATCLCLINAGICCTWPPLACSPPCRLHFNRNTVGRSYVLRKMQHISVYDCRVWSAGTMKTAATIGSATADATCQSKSCQPLHSTVGTSCNTTTNPQQIEVMELEGYSRPTCNILVVFNHDALDLRMHKLDRRRALLTTPSSCHGEII